jgi:hypothetical protein
MASSALSFSLWINSRASAASVAAAAPRGRVPLIGRVSTRRPLFFRNLSGDELIILKSPQFKYAPNGAGLMLRNFSK